MGRNSRLIREPANEQINEDVQIEDFEDSEAMPDLSKEEAYADKIKHSKQTTSKAKQMDGLENSRNVRRPKTQLDQPARPTN